MSTENASATAPVQPIVSLLISRVEHGENGEWMFFNSDGDRIAAHMTPGHMARMYVELYNDRIRVRDTLKEIGDTATDLRKHASDALDDDSILCPYSDNDTERFCYFRGMREALTGINTKAYDALNAG